MISIRTFQDYFPSILKLKGKLQFGEHPFRERLQEWVRQEIVDDDPHDEETFFPQAH